MSILLTMSVAIRALLRNKMRAALTVLGIVIGIGAVTTMVSIGTSAGQLVQNELQSIGTNFIFIQPAVRKRGGVQSAGNPTLTVGDAEAIGTECQSVLVASPLIGTGGIPVVRGNNNMQPNDLHGVGVDYLRVRNWQLEAGGFFFRARYQFREYGLHCGTHGRERPVPDGEPVGEDHSYQQYSVHDYRCPAGQRSVIGRPGSGQRFADAVHHG